MQQRRLRLGDILDDYCPRERRITNHAIVAMIDDQVKQTRRTTCDADHEYKQARVPAPRRKKDGVLAAKPPAETPQDEQVPGDAEVQPPDEAPVEIAASPEAGSDTPADADEGTPAPGDDEGPVHRRLIRATLPRPEGQAPERKTPDFTVRQPGGRGRDFDANRSGAGQRHGRGPRPVRGPHHGESGGQPPRFGGPRQGNPSRHGSAQGDRQNGNRPGPGGGQRGGGRPAGQGQPRGPRPPGRKRGR